MNDHPSTPAIDKGDPADCVARQASRFDGRQSDLLPLLHAVQQELGFIPDAAVPPHRVGAQSEPRRCPRHAHLLPRFPAPSGGQACRQTMSRADSGIMEISIPG
jgi:hypothetical protein